MPIKLPKGVEEHLISSIRRYFSENMDEPIGDLKAQLLLDYCLREIGPSFYNLGVADAQKYMQEKIYDLEAACSEAEFTYWRK